MNLDFGAEPLFSWYVVLLCLSGIAMFVLSAIGRSGQSTGVRAFTALVGAGFLGYGVYLGFIFDGGTYLIVFKAFILPALLLVNFIRALTTRNKEADPTPSYPNHNPQSPYAAQPTYGPQFGSAPQPGYPTQPDSPQPNYGPNQGQNHHPNQPR